jgi:D-xylono/L-arabinono-1,4-lactonase
MGRQALVQGDRVVAAIGSDDGNNHDFILAFGVQMSRAQPRISDIRCALGEGPLWDQDLGQLYVTDAFKGTVSVLEENLQVRRSLEFGRTTSAMTQQVDGSILFFHDRGAITRLSPAGVRECLLENLPGEERGVSNDVITDPRGRVLVGMQPVGERPGRLYCLQPDLSHRILLDDVQEPNGLGFSLDHSTLYFTDSGAQTIYRFAYDESTGSISERQILLKTSGSSIPDGLTVDVEGFIWAALWNGGCVIRIDPKGRIVRTISVPALRTTSVTFGGPALETLYVTSAIDGAESDAAKSSTDGAVFAVQNCGRGRLEFRSRLGM